MNKIIQEAMTSAIVEEASKLYQFSMSDVKHIGGFENHVYEYEKDNKFYILRFVHNIHREEEHVIAELEFIDYLNQHGASVSTVVHSCNDRLVERVPLEDGNYFSISAFTKAPGGFVKEEDLGDELFYQLGKDVGILHRLSKEYHPKHRRYHWYEEDYVAACKPYVPAEDEDIIEQANKIIETIQSLPMTNDNYGLIHTDLHFGNMYYDNGTFTFFDFDDSSYKHYISDIAIILYYYFSFRSPIDENRIDRTKQILRPFLRGYISEHKLDSSMFQYLNDFLKLRETVLYLVLKAHIQGEPNPAREAFVQQLQFNIRNHVPFYESLTFVEELLEELKLQNS